MPSHRRCCSQGGFHKLVQGIQVTPLPLSYHIHSPLDDGSRSPWLNGVGAKTTSTFVVVHEHATTRSLESPRETDTGLVVLNLRKIRRMGGQKR
jgi:hypothetical protein